MKVIGWAAIIFAVHDALSFAALALLIAGEITLALIGKRKRR